MFDKEPPTVMTAMLWIVIISAVYIIAKGLIHV